MKGQKGSRKFRFTKRGIENLEAHDPSASGSRAMEYSDAECIGLRVAVSANGQKTFYWRYSIYKRKRVISIGSFPAVAVQEARQRCWDYRNMVSRGLDPLVEKDKQKNTLTFAEFCKLYVEHSKTVNKSWRHFERMIDILIPIFGRHLLTSISQRDVQKHLDSIIANKRSGATHNRTRSLVHRMFQVAIDWGYMTTNPASGTKKLPENPEERHWITVEDSQKLLAALEEIPKPWRVSACAVKFLLVTGKRLAESMRIRWTDLDEENRVVFLRLETMKGKRPAKLFLSDLAMEVIEELKEYRREDSPYLFPGLKPGARLTTPRKVFATAKELAGIDSAISLHGLRHGYASNLLDMGATVWEVKKLLNHQDISTTQKYLHAKDDSLMRRTQDLSNQYQNPT